MTQLSGKELRDSLDKLRQDQLEERLRLAYELVSDTIALQKDTLPVPMLELLDLVRDLCDQDKTFEEVTKFLEPPKDPNDVEDRIIVSCDASITKNPGGQVAVGFVIRFPPEDGLPPVKLARETPSTTNNQGEYDAIYEAITTLFATHNRPKHPVLVRSDSQIVVKQLMGEYKFNDKTLQRKAEAIHELCAQLPVPVNIEWKRRNSTPDLEEANFLAQDKLGVKRH